MNRETDAFATGSCVVTIMMLEWFHPGQLPAGKGYNTASTDVSTYRDIWNAARSIENACTVSKSPGWLMTGESFLSFFLSLSMRLGLEGKAGWLIRVARCSRQEFCNGGIRVGYEFAYQRDHWGVSRACAWFE